MKTLTEFSAVTLKQAVKTKTELSSAGKTPEELPAAMGETLKVEGDKLALLLAAVDAVAPEAPGARGPRLDDLKRVVVLTIGEGEKAPSGAKEKDGKHFLVEYYPAIESKKPGRFGGRDDRHGGGKRGKKGGKARRRTRPGSRRRQTRRRRRPAA